MSEKQSLREQIESELRLMPGGSAKAGVLALMDLTDAVRELVEATENHGPCQHNNVISGDCQDCGRCVG